MLIAAWSYSTLEMPATPRHLGGMDGHGQTQISVITSLAKVAAEAWDELAGTGNPFVRHAWLNAMEQSGSATGETGWHPCHLLARDGEGRLVGAAPLYLKTHSYGEYVFDWGWAEAYQRAGGRYYPKLQCAVPFTPVTGPRLMGDAATRHLLAAAMIQLARDHKASSVHVTFPTEAEFRALEATSYLGRMGCQYHWDNQGYGAFDDFLGALASRKRKSIRKEREAVARQGLSVTTLVGADVKAHHWDAFHRFYQMVVDRKWGSAYLERSFFEILSASELGDKVVLVWAEQDGHPVAAAFNMLGADTLYGRTWGAGADHQFLHFEACYYRAIDFAIRHGLARVEAGAQGEHKVSRGYLPSPTWSAHWIADPGLARAVARFLEHERPLIQAGMDEQRAEGPYRQDGGG
jgi:predicted N-acyltransferase